MQRFRSLSRPRSPASLGLTLACALLWLGGCATQTPTASVPPGGVAPSVPGAASPAPPRAAPQPTLAAEQKRLAALFDGTPVVFAMQGDGSLRVEVPLRYSFDAGSSTVKPPLAAVLERIARSQRRAGSRLLVVAPGD